MNFDRKRVVGGYLTLAAGIFLALASFAFRRWRRDDLPIEWMMVLLSGALLLCAIGIWITPDFRWSRWRFSTALKDPSKEQPLQCNEAEVSTVRASSQS